MEALETHPFAAIDAQTLLIANPRSRNDRLETRSGLSDGVRASLRDRYCLDFHREQLAAKFIAHGFDRTELRLGQRLA
jgi:hypothetical protein